MATVAWFFWNPQGWSFEWEPIVVFFASLAAFITFDIKEQSPLKSSDSQVHPADVTLFNEFLQLLPSAGVIEFLRTHDFLGSFRRNNIEPINTFVREWSNAEHEFQDKDIEKQKQELYEAAQSFVRLIGSYTSPNNKGFQSVIPDYYEDGEERERTFKKEAEEIGDAADLVVEKHQEIIKVARSKLGH